MRIFFVITLFTFIIGGIFNFIPQAKLVEASENPLVFIFAGQSNMQGEGDFRQVEPNLLIQPTNVIFYNNGKLSQLWEQRRFGPELLFAHKIASKYPNRKIYIFKEAYGGTSLLEWIPNWNPEDLSRTKTEGRGSLYQKIVREIKGSIGVQEVEFGGFFWMQGEADSQFKFTAEIYEDNFKRMVDRLFLDLETTMPVIIGQINPRRKGFPYSLDVMNAQNRLAEDLAPFATLITTYEIKKEEDRLHFNTQGILDLGDKFFYGYMDRL